MADSGITPSASQPPARLASNDAMRRASLGQLLRTPVARQLMLLVGVAVAVALGVAIVLWSRGPNMGLLYANLAQKDASDIVQALQTNQEKYTLGSNGTSIFVPAADIDSLRLRLAAQGLPQGNASSRAIEQPDSAFGMSDAAEAIRNRQLLEQDLERTIGSLQSIQSARVHLALPKPSAFIRDNDQPSASVLVTLYQGRKLSSSQVAAIVHLVASSVPNLDPSRVSVVDQQGQLLTGTVDPETAVDNQHLQMAARVENSYAQRVEHILAPLVGADHVRAQVHVDMDFSDSRSASETYGKDKQALRSEQVSSQTTRGNASGGAIPGALSNQPPVTVQQPTAANPGANPGATPASSSATATNTPVDTSNSATRNYEVDRTIRYTTDPAGAVKRLSVAVIVDNKQVTGKDGKVQSVPIGKAELAQLTQLAQSAVGYDAQRGDVVSVVNEPFHSAPTPGEQESEPFWQRPGVMDLVKQGLGVLAALLLAFGLLRPILRGLLRDKTAAEEAPRPLAAPAQPRVNVTVAGLEDERGGNALPGAPKNYEQKVGAAKRMAAENPRQVAQIVKNWVAADGA